MAFHPDSIRKMTKWQIVDGAGAIVQDADSVTTAAIIERRRPVDVAKREAKNIVNVEAGDAPVFAVRA